VRTEDITEMGEAVPSLAWNTSIIVYIVGSGVT
jgi:hypothetical protein